MKIMDKNGRLFGKISVIDLIVVLVVALLAAALHAKTNTKEITGTAVTDQTITYELLVEGVPRYVADAIRVGDPLYEVNRSTGGSLGRVAQVEVLPGEILKEYDNGTTAPTQVEDGVNLRLTIEGEGIISDGRVMINRIYDLGINAAREFYTSYAQFVATVVSIQK